MKKSLSMAADQKVFQLQCSWQSYPWGKRGGNSEVANLLKASDSSFELDEQATYAELWMGTHCKWPSLIQGTEETLENWLSNNPEAFGANITSQFGQQLPFLLKVLSIDKALAIQAHPGKELAANLHARDPTNYLDSNHKPEMALALTSFRGMCGFRPVTEIASFLQDANELVTVVGQKNADSLIEASTSTDTHKHELAIKCCFATLMKQEESLIQTELRKLVEKVRQLELEGHDTNQYQGQLLLQLYQEFPDDVGCFCVYFLNVIDLQPGEAINIDTGVIHAYFEGDCIECLASSDNVLRGGLTANYKDVDTFVEMLKYDGRPADDFKLQGASTEEGGCLTQSFCPPVKDFSLMQIQIPAYLNSSRLPALESASIVICIKGHGAVSNRTVKSPITTGRGVVLFIAASEECVVKSDSDMLWYRAYVC